MFKMTRVIQQVLENADAADAKLKVFTEESETSSMVWLQFGIKNGGSYRIRFISRDDDNDVAVRVFGLISVDSEEQKAKVLPVLNRLNNEYRFIKFVMDKDGDVNLEYDYMADCPDPSASALEAVLRIVKMVDDTYPELMRAMWA